ncbi:hypothetical protein P7K49_002525 [Saguinus oedipus]|uniref:Uncharacterized protein n=1 Tax=Saguinus oedipus TaxID=9490 RepID=A0ABQ9WHL0_SAGOE|nr:hypothetical protein P7K49_002525 [Saguinus oedipus]
MRGSCERSGEDEEQKEEATAACGRLSGVPEAKQGSEADSDSDLETEGTHGLGELVGDTLYLRSCQVHSVVPISCFLCQGSAPELNLRHSGLGSQGLLVLLVDRGGGLITGGDIGAVRAFEVAGDITARHSHQCDGCPFTMAVSTAPGDLDLSENQLGVAGAQALCATLTMNRAVQKMQLSGNDLEEQAAQHLAELLLAHTDLKSLDLSYNQLNDQAAKKILMHLPREVNACQYQPSMCGHESSLVKQWSLALRALEESLEIEANISNVIQREEGRLRSHFPWGLEHRVRIPELVEASLDPEKQLGILEP